MSEFPYKIEQCVWELTLRCNMRCADCRAAGAAMARRELTVQECLRVAEQLIEQGCRRVTFIGGEIFLYDGWDRIARRLDDGKVRVSVTTNGLLSGRKLIDQLRRARPANIGVAIDGMEAGHEYVRGVPGSFRRAVDLMGRLRAEAFAVGVVTSLTESNVGDLPAMYDMLLGLGAEFWQIQLAASAAGPAGPSGPALGTAQMPDVTRFIAEKRAEGSIRIHADDEIGHYAAHEPPPDGSTALGQAQGPEQSRGESSPQSGKPGTAAVWRGCQAGLRGAGIDSAGNVRGCQALADERFIEGNLHTQTLAEIWRRPGAFSCNRRFQPRPPEGQPTGCDMGRICRAGCRSVCFFAAGQANGNPYCRRRPTTVPVRLVARKAPAARTTQQAPAQGT